MKPVASIVTRHRLIRAGRKQTSRLASFVGFDVDAWVSTRWLCVRLSREFAS